MPLLVLLVSAELFFLLPTPEKLSGLPLPRLWAKPLALPQRCSLRFLSSLSPV